MVKPFKYLIYCLFHRSFSGEGYVFPYPKECSDILDTFAQYASDFTLCSIQNARPIRLCEKCVHHYVNFHDKYQELMTTESNGTKCRSIFISQDRLDAILEYHDNILSVWNKGHCAGKLNSTTICFNPSTLLLKYINNQCCDLNLV